MPKIMKENRKMNVQRLAVSAVFIALSALLSMIKVFEMPLGGSVTLLSMLPVCLLSIMYGCKWGLVCSFGYSLTQLALGAGAVVGWGLTPAALIGCFFFDYIAAFTVLGLSGVFRGKGVPGCIGGIALAALLRVCCHVVSGAIFFSSWAPEGWNALLYSICYNAAFMAPELVFTAAGTVFLLKEPHTARLFRAAPRENKQGRAE